MDSRILDELETAFGQELALVGDDLGALETSVQGKLRQLGQGLLQRLLGRQPHGYQGSSIPCSCGAARRFVAHRAKGIHTAFGWIEIGRAYYHCWTCKSAAGPYDQASGLGNQQLSPGLARACSVLAVDDSFEESSRKIEELLAQEVSANSIERLVHQVGRQFDDWASPSERWQSPRSCRSARATVCSRKQPVLVCLLSCKPCSPIRRQ